MGTEGPGRCAPTSGRYKVLDGFPEPDMTRA